MQHGLTFVSSEVDKALLSAARALLVDAEPSVSMVAWMLTLAAVMSSVTLSALTFASRAIFDASKSRAEVS